MTTVLGLLLPFAGTAAGSACVFLLRRSLRLSVHRFLLGFAAGVMTAASVFSLLLPAIEASAGMGRLAFVPAAVGTLLGLLFLPAIRAVTPTQAEAAPVSARRRAALLCLAVTIHNIPEGMAPGVAFAGALNGGVSMAAAWSLALGIAIQNFPEGAVISMPMAAAGEGRGRAFALGVLSGAVEPAAAGLSLLLTGAFSAALPWALSFAAGAMLYVAAAELIPEAGETDGRLAGLSFGAGFLVMMILDVSMG
ncbi:MAG: ZIP family metal transporter [Oscillospiraceae bacterium]|nr:ZIP family metal transporter [Oscillospiraceae bacterium]